MQSDLVSIMMPVYNAERFVGQAIESVLGQSYPNWELILVNDGSNDDTQNIIERFSDNRIKVFSQLNGGEAVARNTALDAVSGEFLAFLDADDYYSPDHLLHTITILKENPTVGAVYSDGYYCDQEGNKLQTISSRRRGPFECDLFEEMIKSPDVIGGIGCTVLRSNRVFASRLTFDNEIIIGPDWDFLIRFSESATFLPVNNLSYYYRVHDTNISKSTKTDVRSKSLARCRIKAIQLDRFNKCSYQTRYFVFYELLVDLLNGMPEIQTDIIEWPQVKILPKELQAKLLRLMTTKAIITNGSDYYISRWIHLSRSLDSLNIKSLLLSFLYFLNPWLLKNILKLKYKMNKPPTSISPFNT